MHRSGTSALTRALSLAGLDLPPDTGRVWESRTIIRLDDRILAHFGLEWFQPGEIATERLVGAELAGLRREAVQALATLFGPSGHFVLKEPRMARLVPFWDLALREFGAEPRYVLAVRNPPDVASSLESRNDMDTTTALTLWTDHIAAAERDTRPHRRAVSDYRLLLRDKSKEIERLVAALELPLPPLDEAKRSAIDAFVSDDSEHFRMAADDLLSRSAATVAAAALYARMIGDAGPEAEIRGLVAHLERCTAIPPSTPLHGAETWERPAPRPVRTARRKQSEGGDRPAANTKRHRGGTGGRRGRGRMTDLVASIGRLLGFRPKAR